MNSILESLNLPTRYDRLADLIAAHAGWFTDMEKPCPDYRALCVSYGKLAIADNLRGKCRTCPVGMEELTRIVTIVVPHGDGHYPVPIEPAVVAKCAIDEMIAEGFAEEFQSDGFGPLYVVNDEPAKSSNRSVPSALTRQMRVWASEAIAADARINARIGRDFASPPPPSRRATLRRSAVDELDRARKFLGIVVAAPKPEQGN